MPKTINLSKQMPNFFVLDDSGVDRPLGPLIRMLLSYEERGQQNNNRLECSKCIFSPNGGDLELCDENIEIILDAARSAQISARSYGLLEAELK